MQLNSPEPLLQVMQLALSQMKAGRKRLTGTAKMDGTIFIRAAGVVMYALGG
jgi:hypothetical protein